MIHRAPFRLFLLFFLSYTASAQVLSFPSSQGGAMTNMASSALNAVQATTMDGNLFSINSQNRSPLESPNGALSKLDLKAPGKARREFDKGYQLLLRKDLPGAVEHLTTATSIYPSFVAAHNALGTAYLGLAKNDQARAEFAQAVALDDHLPNSYLNLGCAELALQHFAAAEESIQKASAIAPLDLTLLTALSYGQFMNHNYAAAVATAHQVHDRKHDGAALVHFYAAAAWEAQENIPEAQRELQTLLREDPKSPAAAQAVQMMQQLKDEQDRPPAPAPEMKISFREVPAEAPSGPVQLPESVRKLMQESKESAQIAEAEADAKAEAECPACGTTASPVPAEADVPAGPAPQAESPKSKYTGFTMRASADEVAIFFTATDHRKPVTNLTARDIGIRDDHRLPAAIIGLRNESELPLRLGLLIDTSSSIEGRFKFEQESAANFLKKVVTGPDDLAFLIGFANSVLLVQDFTGDQQLISRGVGKLVPSGGTALWDAVDYAAEKLANRPEAQPVARVLVIISDGEDNSSSVTLKEAINRAQRADVAVYTVSTMETLADPAIQTHSTESLMGEHALATAAELTGGAAFSPGSVHRLDSSLADLQQVIRSRYLVSYKPALFKRDGQYRAIDITAAKGGHKLRVYARKGYYASASSPGAVDHF
jgi:Ca-activated chloride channel family protein